MHQEIFTRYSPLLSFLAFSREDFAPFAESTKDFAEPAGMEERQQDELAVAAGGGWGVGLGGNRWRDTEASAGLGDGREREPQSMERERERPVPPFN